MELRASTGTPKGTIPFCGGAQAYRSLFVKMAYSEIDWRLPLRVSSLMPPSAFFRRRFKHARSKRTRIINKIPPTTPAAIAATGVFFSGWLVELVAKELVAKEPCPVGVLEETASTDECDTTKVDTDVDTAVLVVEASANVVVKVWMIIAVES